jgi:hypothetical protein
MLYGTNVVLGIAVTVQTEGHTVRFGMLYSLHLINPTVTCNATYTTINVGRVIKINIVRCLVYLDPFDWEPRLKALANGS